MSLKKKIILFLSALFGIFLLSIGLNFYFFLFLFYLLINLVWQSDLSFVKAIKKHFSLLILSSFTLIFFTVILLRLFFIEIGNIPSSSMKNTLLPGDKIIINHMAYGPRVPRNINDVPWLNIFTKQGKVQPSESNTPKKKLPFRRIKGYQNIKREDVIVFDTPFPYGSFMIKHCVGIPGDSIHIIKGRIFVNGQEITRASTVPERYKILGKESVVNDCIWQKSLGWNPDNLGPLLVPQQGLTVDTSARTQAIYKRQLEALKKSSFTFTEDFYFVVGDNMDNSQDSRYWGFVPKNSIKGKVDFKLYSPQGPNTFMARIE